MIKALKGMKDLLDEQGRVYAKIIKVCEEVAQNYGFSFINVPHLEQKELFKRSVGESSDIVGKEMYEFNDKAGNEVCLRPEGTAGVVRAYIEAKFDKNVNVKRWFYHGSMFRYERPQKGRLREFHQFGVESFGTKSVFEDASLILMLQEILKRLEIKADLKLNYLGCPTCMSEFRAKFLAFVDAKEGFCEDCLRRKSLNPIRMLDCKNEHCQILLEKAPRLSKNLCKNCQEEFTLLQGLLKENGVNFELDDNLVRGLDYYSKTAFEFVSDEIGAKSAIAGGGRYDRLISYLSGAEGFGIGFAMGIERIAAIVKAKEPKREGIYLCALDELYLQRLFALALHLRAKNKQVFFSYEAKKLDKHLNSADKMNCKFFLCMGENEAKSESVFCKNLQDKSQRLIEISKVENEL